MGLEMNVKWGDRGCEEEFNDAAYFSTKFEINISYLYNLLVFILKTCLKYNIRNIISNVKPHLKSPFFS